MKLNFDDMSKAELRAYVLQHRDDLDAIEALFNRRNPNSEAIVFHSPQSKDEEQQQFELFQRLVKEKEGQGDSVV